MKKTWQNLIQVLWQFDQFLSSASFIFVPFSSGPSIIVAELFVGPGAYMLSGLNIEEKRESASQSFGEITCCWIWLAHNGVTC